MGINVYQEWLGIPSDVESPNHYELLRLVQFEDDAEKIRKHYKRLNGHVRKYATGQYSVESQELLNELAKAMLCLTDSERKREYDEGLGREFHGEEEDSGPKSLPQVLIDRDIITRSQVSEIEDFANARGLSVRDAVVQMKLTDAETAAEALAIELKLPYVDLMEMTPDDSVLDGLPRSVVKRHQALPLFEDDDTLLVACVDQPETELEDEIRLRFNIPMRGVIATPKSINQGIAKYYAPGMRDESNVPAKSKKKKGKASSGSKPEKVMSQLSDEEKRDRKLIGYMMILWSVVGSALIDSFLLPLTPLMSISIMGYLFTFLIPPIVIFWVLKSYWK